MKGNASFGLAIAGIFSALTVQAATAYKVTSVTSTYLGTLGGTTSEANDINDKGRIVGTATNRAGVRRAFIYALGSMTDVGASIGAEPSEGAGLNNHNQVVGWWTNATGKHAYLWEAGLLTPLAEGAPVWNEVESRAVAISDKGHIVGQITYPDVEFIGFSVAKLWTDPATSYSLDPSWEVGYYSSIVTDVDERDRASGWDTYWHDSWMWKPGSPPDANVPAPLVGAGYSYSLSDALGLHEKGGEVGSFWMQNDSTGNWVQRPFFWDGTSVHASNLGSFRGGNEAEADDINAQRFIAGWSERYIASPAAASGYFQTAFLYHKDFGLYALPRPKLGQCRARALNDRKASGLIQVVGWCDNGAGPRAIRWDVTVAQVVVP